MIRISRHGTDLLFIIRAGRANPRSAEDRPPSLWRFAVTPPETIGFECRLKPRQDHARTVVWVPERRRKRVQTQVSLNVQHIESLMEKQNRSTRRYVVDHSKSMPPTLSLTSSRMAGSPASSQLVTFSWSGLTHPTRWRR
jgi:hypothetical protein